ncbi:uncharacterized protein A1O9_05704 [Exophiala aquamarina CBS 119918]|uniref:HMG box domain-containing protein n=1 Tax=Exophiala aquamarina CBS 119918 TaxID=1182545 RepID=A0A072PCJ4_9EURO|nr:uncharacterized protein A1O9_05704 [Exophiala aquamarina CBS 119918]KEF57784.1 hypothetical protein A1O9_05704 [Exophiala aquamarina CBS 119918]
MYVCVHQTLKSRDHETHQQSSIIAQNPGIPNPEVSKIIGEQWRHLSTKAKEEWNMLAEAEKARHQEQYPGYRYHPRRSGRVSNQPSASGPSSAESQEPCAKCGGKPILNSAYSTQLPNPKSTQQSMATQIPGKRGYVVSGPHGQIIHGQPTVSPEHLAQQKSFVEAYPFSRVDPRLIYAVPPTAQRAPPSDSQDPKRRRYNNNGVYVPAGQPYPEPTYSYPHSPMNNAYTRGEAMQQLHAQQLPAQRIHGMQPTKAAIMSPPRGVYPHPPQLQPVRPPHPHQRARSTVALPPIETVLSHAPIKASSTSSQRSGVEAMIMSIPVLNKIKVLSQISGPLPTPGLTSPKPQVRGAIIAIEGMDASSVNSITISLADQLGREGNFAVKTFDGPDPYTLVREARSGVHGRGGNITTESYLKMLSEWHKTSKEIVEYITTRPQGQAGDKDTPIALDSPFMERTTTHSNGEADVPLSAISPKTIYKAAELSIASPPSIKGRSQSTPGERPIADAANLTVNKDSNNPTSMAGPLMFPRPVNSSRIPPMPTPAHSAAIVPEREAETPPQETQGPQADSDKGNENAPVSAANNSNSVIPIALVPHFQLTTVDASSISMPISDGFSPPAHWQWFATLWRGSVGPDVTIVIKSTEEDTGDGASTVAAATRTAAAAEAEAAGDGGATDTNTRPAGPSTMSTATGSAKPSAASQFPGAASTRQRTSGSTASVSNAPSSSGVEIRLNDYRAVIVKTGIFSTANSAEGSGNAKQVSPKELEYWEKAKRRIGFEVEEFLRK